MLAVCGPGEHYYADTPHLIVAAHFLYQFIPVHLGHVEIHQDQVRDGLVQNCEGVLSVAGFQNLVMVYSKEVLYQFPVIFIVVNYQDSLAGRREALAWLCPRLGREGAACASRRCGSRAARSPVHGHAGSICAEICHNRPH